MSLANVVLGLLSHLSAVAVLKVVRGGLAIIAPMIEKATKDGFVQQLEADAFKVVDEVLAALETSHS